MAKTKLRTIEYPNKVATCKYVQCVDDAKKMLCGVCFFFLGGGGGGGGYIPFHIVRVSAARKIHFFVIFSLEEALSQLDKIPAKINDATQM